MRVEDPVNSRGGLKLGSYLILNQNPIFEMVSNKLLYGGTYMLPFEEAVEKINEVLKQDPENANMWCSLGVALIELKKYDEAAEKFEKATKLNPQLPAAWYGWGITLKALGQEKTAAEKIKTAMEMDQNNGRDSSEPEK